MHNPEPHQHRRCKDGAGCNEVIDRTRGADVAQALGFPGHANQLRMQAQQWAERHHYGSPPPPPEEEP